MNKSGITSKVMLFLAAGIILMALLLILFAKTSTLFRPSYEIRMRTSHVGELKPGNGVFLSGLRIGDVTGVELESDLKHAIVKMRIIGEYKIGKNARFAIHQQGFLGQYYVEVIANGTPKEFLKDGDLVESEDTIDFIQAGKLTYGLFTRVKEALKSVELTMERSRKIFNSNTFSRIEFVSENFGNALAKGTSLVFTVEYLVESNSPTIERFLSDIECVNKDWKAFRTSFTQFTNQVTSFSDKIEPELKTMSSNFSEIKQQVNQLMVANQRDGKKETNAISMESFTERIGKIMRVTAEINEFSSNLNRLGLIGAFKKEGDERKSTKEK